MDEYHELLIDAYRGERFGESFFGSMAERAHGAEHGDQLRTLQQVEARTASRLAPLVVEAGLDHAADSDGAVREGEQLATALDETTWAGFLEQLRGALPDFLTKFERLQVLAGDRHDATMRDLVAHEQAIDRFAMLELDGRTDEALAVLHAHLERP